MTARQYYHGAQAAVGRQLQDKPEPEECSNDGKIIYSILAILVLFAIMAGVYTYYGSMKPAVENFTT